MPLTSRGYIFKWSDGLDAFLFIHTTVPGNRFSINQFIINFKGIQQQKYSLGIIKIVALY